MARFDGRVAIVTGAASGIGKEIAKRLAAEGGIPVIADLNLKAAEAAAAEIRSGKADAFAVAMNVTDEAQVELERAMREFLPNAPLTWMIGLGANAVAAEVAGEGMVHA